ncbi:MAG: efflux RND transporter periplasmic adaptor subunit [Polyangiaceae bacterium]
MPFHRHLYWVFVVLAAGSLSGCKTSLAATTPQGAQAPSGEVLLTPQQVRETRIEIQTVADQNLDSSIVTSGRVTLDDLRSAHVFSPVTGRVARITAQLGQHVSKGEPLAVIESPDIGSAVSDVHKAQADLVATEHDRNRKKQLYEEKAGSASDLEASNDNWRKAKAELERAQQKQALLRVGNVNAVTQSYTLTSPIDGEVLLRNINPGIEVQGQYTGGAAQELFTIGEVDKVWVLADLYESDLGRVHVGMSASVTVVAYPSVAYKGEVDWVSAMLDPVTRTAKVRCTFANPEKRMRPEMYATVRISVDQKRALAVPRDAVVHLGDTKVAFIQLDGDNGNLRFRRVPVEVDEGETGPWAVVTRGLERGQAVVANGAALTSQNP